MNLLLSILIELIILINFTVQSHSVIANIDEDCLKCICTANSGCTNIIDCFEDTNDEIRCGMFLLRESQWNQVMSNGINLRKSNISNFDECYRNYDCSSDLVNAYTLINFLSNDFIHNKITCADVAIYNQFGINQNNLQLNISRKNDEKIKQYATILKTHHCMNKTLANFQTKLMINKLNLPDKQNHLNVSIVPRRCFDCIRTANNYNSENSNSKFCLHPLQKCGPYAINFEYFLKANGNEVTKTILNKFYNQTSELENQNHLLDTIDLLNKLTNVDGQTNKQLRIENDYKHEDNKENDEDIDNENNDNRSNQRIDYNQKLTQLLNLGFHPLMAKSMKDLKIEKRKNSKLLTRLVNKPVIKSRRNSKFSKESNGENEKKSIKNYSFNNNFDDDENEQTANNIFKSSVQKLLDSSSYQNFVRCAINQKCSEQLINIYVNQHLVDCNLDQSIDCDDYASIHWLGNKCTFLKQNTMLYSNLWKNFEYCSILADDVRKEEIIDGNDKNYYNYDLPSFHVRPNLTNPPTQTANQYYSINFVDLSNDCLQCICEASSDNYNCTQILMNHYSSAYYSSALQPQPPRIVYLKTNNRMPKNEEHFINVDHNFDDNERSDYNPFSITKQHFLESMINTFWYKGAAGDWNRCAESIECSIECVSKFVTRFSMDCTKDGRLSCSDFGLIYRFKDHCGDLNVLNTDYYRKFEKCLIKFGLH